MAMDEYEARLTNNGEVRGVVALSLGGRLRTELGSRAVLALRDNGNIRVEGGFCAIPEHLDFVVGILGKVFFPYAHSCVVENLPLVIQNGVQTKETALRVAILGTASQFELNEKIRVLFWALGYDFVRATCWFDVIDKRPGLIETLSDNQRRYRSGVWVNPMLGDLLNNNDVAAIDAASGGGYHLAIAHLTADYSRDPVQLAEYSYYLISPGGMLIVVTKDSQVVSKLLQLGRVEGVCWANDKFFDQRETACVVVRK